MIPLLLALGLGFYLWKHHEHAGLPVPRLGDTAEVTADDGSHHWLHYKQAGAGFAWVAASIDTANHFKSGTVRRIAGRACAWFPGLNAFVPS